MWVASMSQITINNLKVPEILEGRAITCKGIIGVEGKDTTMVEETHRIIIIAFQILILPRLRALH